MIYKESLIFLEFDIRDGNIRNRNSWNMIQGLEQNRIWKGIEKGLQFEVMIKTMIFELRLKQKFWDLRSFDLGEKWIKTGNIGKRLIVA